MSELPEPVDIMGAPVAPWTMSQTVGFIERAIDEGRFLQHVVVNATKLANMRTDPGLREAVLGAELINADGMGVLLAGRVLGRPIPERVTGIDLFGELLALAERRGWGVYLLGAKPEVIEVCAAKVREKYPDLEVHFHDGYFWDEEEAQVERVRASGAKLLFVGISSPMKEQFIDRWGETMGVAFAMGVGGTFDVWAGKVRRAPEGWQRAGMEWAWRVREEPRRMAKRALTTNTRFLMALARTWVSERLHV
ncbi:MAG: glycosyltransferase [Deltaproteobacteria bacterium]|nr:MAG: glycosyltransferase [Deltaproteobacteria bacterium]